MSAIPRPPPDLPEVSGNKSHVRRSNLSPNYNNNNGLSPNKSSGTDSSSNTSSKNATPSHPTTQTDRSIVSERSPTSKLNGPTAAPDPPPQEAGEKEKVWERCWSLTELKQGSNAWTLASDAGLLKYLQDFSQRVTSRTHVISSQVNGLSLESQSSCGRLENVSNRFHKLSMEQFVENRVFDEDETDQTRTESSVSDAAPPEEGKEETEGSSDGDVLVRANQAVKMGLVILDDAFDQVNLTMDPDSDSSGEEGATERSAILPTELEPKDLYLLRPFPSLVGSATFYETDHLGLRLQESSDSEFASDVDESEVDSSGTETEVKQKQRHKHRPQGAGGLDEDVGDSSGDLFSEEENRTQRRGDREVSQGSPQSEEGGLFNTKQGKFTIPNRNKSGDEGNLFDSSSGDEDLFSEEPKKKKEQKQPESNPDTERVATSAPAATDTGEPKKDTKKKKKNKPFAGAVPVFGILDSEDSDGDDESEGERTERFGESVSSTVSATSRDFLTDSDSDGDLFSSHKPVAAKARKDKSAPVHKLQKQETPPVESDIPNSDTPKDKSLFGGDSLNFDDSDSENDLFQGTKPGSDSAAKKPIGGVNIFAGLDQDILVGRNSSTPDKIETNSPTIPLKSEVEKVAKKTTQARGMNLYEDSSSEDDLFTSMSQAKETSKVVVQKEEPKTRPETAKNVPIIGKLDQEPTSSPVASRSQVIANGLKFLEGLDEDSDDDLFSKPKPSKVTVGSLKEISDPIRTSNSPVLKPVVTETDELFTGLGSGNETQSQLREDESDSAESKVPIPIPIPITKAKKEMKSAGLFPLGSDSDEDLFSLSTSKPVRPPEDNTIEQKHKQSDPIPGKEAESGGLFSQDDGLFSAIQPTPHTSLAPATSSHPPEPTPIPAPDLFSELTETDGDDLFGAPASLDLFAATKPDPTPITAPKPKPAKTALPTLFAPIDTGTSEGSLFEQPAVPTEELVPPSLDLPHQQDDAPLPSLTNPLAQAPDILPSTQRISKEQPKNSIEPVPAPKVNLFTDKTENAGEPLKPKTSVGRNTDFLKELNKAMGKGFVPGQPVIKKKSTAAFEDEGELFSNTGPKGDQREPMGAERGTSGIGGYGAPEEPSKLIGVTRSRPKGPAKRPQSRDARKKKIDTSSEDFGNFFTEPTDVPKVEPDRLFNGDLGGGLFLGPADTSYQIRAPAKTQPDIETDILFSGNPNKSKLNTKYDVEEELFPENSHVPVKFHSSKVKLEEDHMASVLPDANKQADEKPPLEFPEDLFASVALPKATKSSKSSNKQKTIPASTLNQAPVEPKPNDVDFEENSVLQEKSKKAHKVVKRTDEELFGGDDLFDAIPETKPKQKSDKTKKKKNTDSTKKTKKVKEFDPSAVDDIFD